MNDREMKQKGHSNKAKTWLIVGVVVLVLLLFFWVDIADILGFGDGAA